MAARSRGAAAEAQRYRRAGTQAGSTATDRREAARTASWQRAKGKRALRQAVRSLRLCGDMADRRCAAASEAQRARQQLTRQNSLRSIYQISAGFIFHFRWFSFSAFPTPRRRRHPPPRSFDQRLPLVPARSFARLHRLSVTPDTFSMPAPCCRAYTLAP